MVTALEILGLLPGASPDDITGAFHRLSLLVHPDHCPGGDGLFRLLAEARVAALEGIVTIGAGFPSEARCAPEAPPTPLRFQWVLSGHSCWMVGVEEGVLSVFRSGDGWRWQIPGPHLGRGIYLDPFGARLAAEVAYAIAFPK